MKININKLISFFLFLLTILFLASLTQAYQNKTSYQKVKFSKEDSDTCIKIIKTNGSKSSNNIRLILINLLYLSL